MAKADPNALYNTTMASSGAGHGGITRSGSPGDYAYSAVAGRENLPVNYVSFYDALRFANWLHNGQPVGPQGPGTTETGAYAITAQGIADNSIARNAGATVALASEDEWYKAAYYDAAGASYFDYPAGTDTASACAPPGATANTANCGVAGGIPGAGNLTAAGSYTARREPERHLRPGRERLGVERGDRRRHEPRSARRQPSTSQGRQPRGVDPQQHACRTPRAASWAFAS